MGAVKKAAKGFVKTIGDVGEGVYKGVAGAVSGDLSESVKGFAHAGGAMAGLATTTFTGGLVNAQQAAQFSESGINYATGNFKAGGKNLTGSGLAGDDPLRIKAKAAAEADAKAAAAESSRLADEANKTALSKERSSLLSLRRQAGIGGKKIGSTIVGGQSGQSASVSQGIILG